MKRIYLVLITLTLFLIETMLLGRFPVADTILPLTFAFGLAVAVVGDQWDALLMGLLTGFLMDVYTNHLFGINMLLNLYLFLGMVFLKKYLRHEKNLLMAVVMGGATLVRFFIHYGLNFITGAHSDWYRVPILALMVLVLGVPLLFLTRRFYRLLKKHHHLT